MSDVTPSACADCGGSVDAIRCVSCSVHQRLRVLVARAELALLVMIIVFSVWVVFTLGGH